MAVMVAVPVSAAEEEVNTRTVLVVTVVTPNSPAMQISPISPAVPNPYDLLHGRSVSGSSPVSDRRLLLATARIALGPPQFDC